MKKNSNLKKAVQNFFLQSWSSAIVAIVLLLVIFTCSSPAFLSAYNLFNLSRTATLYAFIAGAQLMVAVIGGMNLAVGGVGEMCIRDRKKINNENQKTASPTLG